MTNDFEALTGFLNLFSPEVAGRDAAEPSPELKQKLERLAQGSMSAEERVELYEVLRDNPHFVEVLAARMKERRAS